MRRFSILAVLLACAGRQLPILEKLGVNYRPL